MNVSYIFLLFVRFVFLFLKAFGALVFLFFSSLFFVCTREKCVLYIIYNVGRAPSVLSYFVGCFLATLFCASLSTPCFICRLGFVFCLVGLLFLFYVSSFLELKTIKIRFAFILTSVAYRFGIVPFWVTWF